MKRKMKAKIVLDLFANAAQFCQRVVRSWPNNQ